ncbi:MAG: DNA recombination protein RmuC [Candidatus Levybacteria bacterium]|nr:DNA recombination protein RmuC [Candidatus Levybacteria bacterium]
MQVDLPLLIILLLAIGLVYFLISKKLSTLSKPTSDQALLEWLKSMQTSIEATNKTLNQAMHTNSSHMVQTLQENAKQLNQRLDKAAEVITGVGKEVRTMSEIGRSMKELQEFLKSPKLRGNIGEEVLKDLIAQMFPKNSFHLQYQFKSGERVDAAIKTDAGILPIDSKFPMEPFQAWQKEEDENHKVTLMREFVRSVKKHIDDIAKKYIIPEEGTMDFALMYIPSESVYYEVVCMQDVMNYAKKNRVYLVSPTTLYAHLQTILLSFEGKRIETKSREIFKLLRGLQIDYEKLNENMLILGKHLSNATSQFTNFSTGFTQLGNKLQTTKHLEEAVVEELGESPRQTKLLS